MSKPEESNNYKHVICILGDNAKSVAAAMALTYFGKTVELFGLSATADDHIARYHFDKPLTTQWNRSIDEGRLTYHCYNIDLFTKQNYKNYWFFLDQLPNEIEARVLVHLKDSNSDICFSGITWVGRVDELASKLATRHVFYIPFVFLNEASVFNATIHPCLVLVGEKLPHTATHNTVVKTFIDVSQKHHIDSLKTIEFTRSSMMNLMATRLSQINELARLADYCSVDMREVEGILQLDDRLGKGFLRAGWGYGGSTLPKENAILSDSLNKAELSTNIVNEVTKINEDQKELIFRKLWRYFNSYIQDKTILIWGAGYKKGTGRTKNSAIHTLLPLLWNHSITTIIFDPLAQSELNRIYRDDERLQFISCAYDRLDEADALIILNWSQLQRPEIATLNQYNFPVFDAKNLFTKTEIQKLNAHYTGMGRGIL